MSISNVFNIVGSAMSAQSVRMNTIASNIANAQTVAGSEQTAYKAKHPVFIAGTTRTGIRSDSSIRSTGNSNPFTSILAESLDEQGVAGVDVAEIIESDAPVQRRYQPSHPLADEEGYVYTSNVNAVEEMADMISASRSFQMNVEVANSAKSMMQRLITLGQ